MIIAIDGPAGVGKSTVAKLLAARLGFLYLDTGALYRAVAWKVLKEGISPTDQERVKALLGATSLELEFHNGTMQVLIDGRDVSGELRTPEISTAASQVSAIPAVREWLLPIQRQVGERGSVVAEGRDIGTTIFPTATVKFFLDADARVRAERRHRELVAAGYTGAIEATYRDITGRDMQDSTRSIAPLIPAADARSIDTSNLDVEEVIQQMMAAVSAVL